jgi:hypothetical protein
MLSNTSRRLTYLNAVLYAILGGCLFFFPETLAPVFAWKVTAFMTMTIGGWCLGIAWLAFFSARHWQWQRVFTALLYLWMFGVGELIVMYLFRAKLKLVHPIAWLYLITLIVNALTALFGLVDWLRKPVSSLSPEKLSWSQLIATTVFVIFVGFLAYYGCTAQIGDRGTNGGIFPEIMTLFTLRSFGVFYLCVGLAAVPFLFNHNFEALLHHAVASYGLIIFITAAAFVYMHLFNFVERPGGLLYFGAYLGVGIPLLFFFRKYGFRF